MAEVTTDFSVALHRGSSRKHDHHLPFYTRAVAILRAKFYLISAITVSAICIGEVKMRNVAWDRPLLQTCLYRRCYKNLVIYGSPLQPIALEGRIPVWKLL